MLGVMCCEPVPPEKQSDAGLEEYTLPQWPPDGDVSVKRA